MGLGSTSRSLNKWFEHMRNPEEKGIGAAKAFILLQDLTSQRPLEVNVVVGHPAAQSRPSLQQTSSHTSTYQHNYVYCVNRLTSRHNTHHLLTPHLKLCTSLQEG